MGTFLWAFFLALVWAALQGSFSPGNMVFGFLLGLTVVWFMRPLYTLVDSRDREDNLVQWRLLLRAWRLLVLILVFLKELIKSALVVAREVLRPTLRIRPGVIAYPLDVQTGGDIRTLAHLISLTPGTLSIDVSDDRRVLYIHAFLVQSEEATEVRDQIKETLEKHVARALGPLDDEQQSEIHSA